MSLECNRAIAVMYEEASQHWLMAAYWRQMDKKTHGFEDKGHDQALTFCLNNFEFNQALWAWSSAEGVGETPVPQLPESSRSAQRSPRQTLWDGR